MKHGSYCCSSKEFAQGLNGSSTLAPCHIRLWSANPDLFIFGESCLVIVLVRGQFLVTNTDKLRSEVGQGHARSCQVANGTIRRSYIASRGA